MYKVKQTPGVNCQCKRCGTNAPNCVRRYIFYATVTDKRCTPCVSVFNKQAETIFEGRTAYDMFSKCFDPYRGICKDPYNSMFDATNFWDWVFAVKVKQQIMADKTSVNYSI